MDEKSIKVLQILIGGETFSGIASYLYQQYLHMDQNKVHYDFLFCTENSMKLHMDKPIFDNSKFYVLNARKGTASYDYKKIIIELKEILNSNRYDVVVVNTSVISIITACMTVKLTKSHPVFIAHAHSAQTFMHAITMRQKIHVAFDRIFRWVIRNSSDYLFACSAYAGETTFGEVEKKKNFTVIHNGIDCEKYKYDPSVREQVRREMHVMPDTIVYGNVGKLSNVKNQEFLIHIFAKIQEVQENSELWIIGDGADRDKLRSLSCTLRLEDKVKFLGQRDDVNRLLQGMDSFVFTSRSEGLGSVAIEAQAAGLLTTISDGVPDEVVLTDRIQQIPLSSGVQIWADKILNQVNAGSKREDTTSNIIAAGYDIYEETKRVTDFYLSIVRK